MNINEGDRVGGDKITVGDISGSIAAIGAGARVIYQYVERALTDVEVLEQVEAFDRKRLAQAVTDYVEHLQRKAEEAQGQSGRGNPYKALLEYDIDDAALFYGRSVAIEALLDHLERDALTVLHAESGAGKTSLLRAGIMPRLLANGHVPLYVRSRATPAHHAVKRALLPQSQQTPNLATASLYDFLRQVTELLGGKRLVVMLDQFEDVFAEQDEKTRASFVEQLAACLDDDLLPVCWILALRGEWLTQLATFQPPLQHPFANQYLLRTFDDDEAREVIVEPARRRGVTYEPGLADRLVEDLPQKGKIDPPHLQLVCTSLFEQLNGQTRITHAMYEQAGETRGILRSYLERVLSSNVPRERRQAARQLLEALVTSKKRRASRTRDDLVRELAIQGISEKTVDTLLSQLVESRLLRVEEQEANLTYELVHDYLLEQIEIDPEVQTRKAAQELLEREVQAYEQYDRTRVSADRLDIIEPHREHLALSADAFDLLFRSALALGRPLRLWRDSAVRHGLTAALAERWTSELEDEAKAGIAINLLASLSDTAVVSRLADFVASRSPEGQRVSLDRLLPSQRKALIALAHMECKEAEAYLRKLTPDGFCFVPAGSFEMGSGERPDEQPKHSVRLPAFWMDHSPVTVADWQRFIEARAYVQPRYWVQSGGAGMGHRPAPAEWQAQQDREDHPVCNLTWYEAMAYAAWLAETSGLPVALPTEAEWEKAAGWDLELGQARPYPWGEVPDATCCNVQESGVKDTTPVGHCSPAGDSPCGAQDMAGNVLEWTCSEYRPYPYHSDDGREAVSSDRPRVLRGGAFNRSINEARCAYRHLLDPAIGLSSTGCRVCLRLVPLTAEEGECAANDQAPD